MEKLSLEGLDFQATKLDIANHIMTITLNRPEKKNALNNVMMNELNYSLAYAKQERSIRVVVIAAEGDVFCAGADLTRAESESNIPKIEGVDDIAVSVKKAEGEKCSRCWKILGNPCERCSGVLKKLS